MMPRFAHQEEANRRLYNNDVYALIMEQGTGKSRPVIDDWLARVAEGKAQDLVVLGPNGAYMNWIGDEQEPGELMKWVPPELYPTLRIVPWVSGGKAHQRAALENLLHATGPRFLAMNIEALNRKGSEAREYLHKFINNHKVIGTIDESTTVAHEEAARTTFLLDNNYRFKARRILSGLVAPESPLDLYSQYCFLDWRIIGQRSYWGFKNRYAVMQQVDFRPAAARIPGKKYKKPSVIVAFRNLEELTEKILKYSYRVTKAQVLDIPPKLYQFYNVDLTKEQEEAYISMRDVAFARLAQGEFATASQKLDQLGKMQHILCGHVRKEDGTLANIPENRTDAVVEILHRHDGKAIIWAPYPQALRKIRDRLQDEFGPDSTVSFWGEIKQDERLEARARIQNDDACRFIVSNQSLGKFGNTWTACNLVIYYANSFDNEDRQQSEDRPHRIGQTKSVLYIDLRARGTLDEKLIQVLRRKITISAALQGDSFREWLI
jgi:hypothetical protein